MFKLYTEQKPTLSFVDYAQLMLLAQGAKSVLEFGPGISTLALIEAGVPKIVSLEHDPEWLETQKEKFKDYPQVTIAQYADTVPVGADEIAFQDFDLAFVDSPQGFHHAPPGRKPRVRHPGFEDCSRLNTCLFALEQAPIVYLHDGYRSLERATLGRLNAMGHKFTYLPSGIARIERGEIQNRPSASGIEESRGTPAGANP
jgi:hypothetical protein